MSYKEESSNSIAFRLPIDVYNELLEAISFQVDNFHKKIQTAVIETYSKNAGNAQSAIDILAKQTIVDFDVVACVLDNTKFI